MYVYNICVTYTPSPNQKSLSKKWESQFFKDNLSKNNKICKHLFKHKTNPESRAERGGRCMFYILFFPLVHGVKRLCKDWRSATVGHMPITLTTWWVSVVHEQKHTHTHTVRSLLHTTHSGASFRQHVAEPAAPPVGPFILPRHRTKIFIFEMTNKHTVFREQYLENM